MLGSFQRRSRGDLAIMGWSLSRRERQRASMSSLYSRNRSIGGMDASISIVTVGVVLNAPVMRRRHSFCSLLSWFRIWPFRDHQYNGSPYRAIGSMAP